MDDSVRQELVTSIIISAVRADQWPFRWVSLGRSCCGPAASEVRWLLEQFRICALAEQSDELADRVIRAWIVWTAVAGWWTGAWWGWVAVGMERQPPVITADYLL